MACLNASFPVPSLPDGFSFKTPPLPGLPDLTLCCQLTDPIVGVPPIPFVISSGTVAAITAAMQTAQSAVQQFVDQLMPDCPKA